ncbi:MAG TPA: hypothetical protein VFK62_08705 [Gaiellaceae bacterium]|nr:hypothetical protein [Gaiellaceae bacterium]
MEPEELIEALVQRYPEGAPIGWHRDAPAFAPRSGYVLAGESRWKWEHHVPPAKALRYSITFRTLRGSRS